jgi:hypothetical protein
MKALVLATAMDSDDGEEPPHCCAKRVPKLNASAPMGMNNPFEPLDIEESNADDDYKSLNDNLRLVLLTWGSEKI